jgi:hypothetical protein
MNKLNSKNNGILLKKVLEVLGFEFRAFSLLGRCSTTQFTPSA